MSDNAFSLFLYHISTFPTLIFTALVMFVMLYWLVTLLGVADLDTPDLADGDGLSGLLMKFGLNDVPIVVILTFFSLIGWFVSFMLMNVTHTFFEVVFSQTLLRYMVGVVVLILTVAISLWLTNILVRPIRRVAKSNPANNANLLIGKTATVRTMTVDSSFGEAVLEDGGAGLILKVRAFDTTFSQGDKVRLIAYLAEQNAYHVVATAY